jgi:hypothetical protein
MGSGGKKSDNSMQIAILQQQARAQELAFEREEAARQAEFQRNLMAKQAAADDRRFQLDQAAEARAAQAASFNETMAKEQLDYQKARDLKLFDLQQKEQLAAEADRKSTQARADKELQRIIDKETAAATAEAARKAAGLTGYDPFKASLENQLKSGLISFTQAQDYLNTYTAKYDISGKQGDINDLAKLYTDTVGPDRFKTGLGAAYQEILGRKATSAEETAGVDRFKAGYYQTVNDLKESLYKSQEYQQKFNRSYLDSYYDTTYGKEIKDAQGIGTGKRTFNFDKSLLPTYGGNLASLTKVTLPNFASQIEGTPAELEQQLLNIRDSRQFLYSAGLTNLQGDIDKETQKLKNEGAKEVQKIAAQGDIYKNLVGAFNF